ncbi:MAG: hypothetical protein DGJ47_000470 [Rickettsiaceae bacterium]
MKKTNKFKILRLRIIVTTSLSLIIFYFTLAKSSNASLKVYDRDNVSVSVSDKLLNSWRLNDKDAEKLRNARKKARMNKNLALPDSSTPPLTKTHNTNHNASIKKPLAKKIPNSTLYNNINQSPNLDIIWQSTKNISSVIDDQIFALDRIASANDDDNTISFWSRGSFTSGKNFETTNTKYSYNVTSMTFGANYGKDTNIGAAYSYLNGDITPHNQQNNDLNLHLVSLYANINLGSIFITPQTQYAYAHIHDSFINRGRVISMQIKLGKVIHYNENIFIMPTFGTSYRNILIYPNKQSTNINSHDKLTANSFLAGLTTGFSKQYSKVNISPQFHVNFDYGLAQSKLDNSSFIQNEVVQSISASSRRLLYYNIGGSVNVKYRSQLELLLGYDANIVNRFLSHKISFKARCSF